jgi:hypothetical protein
MVTQPILNVGPLAKMIAHHDRIMDMAVVLSLKMTHFEQEAGDTIG